MPQITDAAIKSAVPPETGTITLWDSSLKGFGVRISKGGTKTFIVLITSGRRQKIGRYPLISLATARTEAKRILAEKTLGKIKPTHTAFEDAREDFLEECATRLRPISLKLYRRHLAVHYPLGRTSVADVAPRQILHNLKSLKPSEKEHAFRIGRIFFRWCVRQHLIDRSPMENLETPVNGKSRERVLNEEELRAAYSAARTARTPFHRLVALLIHTGQRKGEMTHLKWDWIAEDTITLPPEITKNGRTHTFPIGKKTFDLIRTFSRIADNPYVFPSSREHVRGKPVTVISGFSAAKRDLDKECGVKDWVLHDLRRTYATGLQRLGIRLEVTEALLNHVSGSRSGVVGIYQRYNWMREAREAAEAWDAYLVRLLAS